METTIKCLCGNNGELIIGEVANPCPICGKKYSFVNMKGEGKNYVIKFEEGDSYQKSKIK
jgi:hypothetical protein